MLLLEIHLSKKTLIYLSCFVILSISFIQVERNRSTVLDKSLAIKIRMTVVVIHLSRQFGTSQFLNLQQCLSRSYFSVHCI